jgi:exosome complex component MTR3
VGTLETLNGTAIKLYFDHIFTSPLQNNDQLESTTITMQADRRRINAPAGGTAPPVFSFSGDERDTTKRPIRTRQPDEHRKIFLRTGVVPSASGSAYYEIPPQDKVNPNDSLVPNSSSLKITCTVHGQRPLPRNAAFSPNLLLSTHIKFAPFATRQRRGWVRDTSERDLGVHLETALRGVIICERWPKSACEVVITVLEGEEDGWWGDRQGGEKSGGWGMMSVLAGCITVASAALVDAGIDCVDLVSGGVAALVRESSEGGSAVVLDPSPPEHDILSACVVGYLQSRDEITEVWVKGDAGLQTEVLLDQAVKAATLTRTVLAEAVKEAVALKSGNPAEAANGAPKGSQGKGKDAVMAG